MRVSTCPGCGRDVTLAEDTNRCDSTRPGTMLYHSTTGGNFRQWTRSHEARMSGLSLCGWGGQTAPSVREVAS